MPEPRIRRRARGNTEDPWPVGETVLGKLPFVHLHQHRAFGGARPDDEFVDNVLVIWTSTRATGGNFIVGRYDGARAFATQQVRPKTK
jgi:hypothetical protein